MLKWILKAVERIGVGLLLGCAGILTVAALQCGFCFARLALIKHDQVIRVTGVHVPVDEYDDYVVYSPAGEFTVSDRVSQEAPGTDPLLLFALGQEYRVQIRGRTSQTLFGTVRPQISHAEPLRSERPGARVALSE